MSSLSVNTIRYGRDEPLPEAIPLRAGPLALLFQNGDLRYVRLGQQEILRRVYIAVRDHNWDTIPLALSNLQIEDDGDAFRIRYDASHQQGHIDFRWRGTIQGDADGTLRFAMDGQAHSPFRRNRIGFCILHPPTCAGIPAKIEHVDGPGEEAAFPQWIAPQHMADGHPCPVAPFENMRAIFYPLSPESQVEIRLEGDTFEMEDQRNWTDASYKTYSTPLALPFPVQIDPGTAVQQAVSLRLHGQPSAPLPEDAAAVVRMGQAAGGPLPRLGLGVSSQQQALEPVEIRRLQALRLSHLRVDLRLAQPDWAEDLRRASQQAQALDARLEVALHLSADGEAELSTLAAQLAEISPPVAHWLIFHAAEKTTDPRWVVLARQTLRAYDPTTGFGGGTDVYFTDLNRERPSAETFDLLCFSVNPQVHAFDNLSLMETPPMQATTVHSARQFSPGTPIAVTPITLRPRFNPNATGPEPSPPPGELPPQVDPRQMSLFGAAWTVTSLHALATAGVESATFFETVGWRGVMESAQGSPLPEQFPSLAGGVFPLFHALADVAAFREARILPVESSQPLAVAGLALTESNTRRLLLANLRAEVQTVTLPDVAGPVRLRLLDETSAERAMRTPDAFREEWQNQTAEADGLGLSLRPYAVATIEF